MIIDLSCPIEASVNTDIDKISYLGTVLFLTFSTGDNITNESKHPGYGALLYRVDVPSIPSQESRFIISLAFNGKVSMWTHASCSGHVTEITFFGA